jgi:divinyl chlorophyllide a 8-vinyl-reductase
VVAVDVVDGDVAVSADTGPSAGQRVFVAGATGYIGRFVVRELVARGYRVVCFARSRSGVGGANDAAYTRADLAGAEVRFGDPSQSRSLLEEGFRGEAFDYVISCLASRTGAPADAWCVDYETNCRLLEASKSAGVRQFVLLSAICVQKPRLAFQRAKLAFEQRLQNSGTDWTIVRPTAFFKSLSGQVEAVKRGRPFTVFGNGELTRCKPISEPDLARYIVDCLGEDDRRNRILPVGGPGPAITPLDQARLLSKACGQPLRLRRVSPRILDVAIGVLDVLARLAPRLKDKAEFARIGRYYATESMLALDPSSGCYDEAATPGFGADTLESFYRRVVAEGLDGQELGDHALFGDP